MFHHVLAPDTIHITIIEIAPDSAETKQWELPWQDTSDILTSVCWMLVNYGPSNDTASYRVFWSSVKRPITKSQLIEPPIHDSGLINLTFCVESNPRLRCFCFTLLCDWSKKLAPFSLPISSVKSKINRVFVIRVLPLHRQDTRCYLSPHWLPSLHYHGRVAASEKRE